MQAPNMNANTWMKNPLCQDECKHLEEECQHLEDECQHLEDECQHLEDEPSVPRLNAGMWEMNAST